MDGGCAAVNPESAAGDLIKDGGAHWGVPESEVECVLWGEEMSGKCARNSRPIGSYRCTDKIAPRDVGADDQLFGRAAHSL